MRAAILTISDSSYEGRREDASGPALGSRAKELGWHPAAAEVLPDDRARIAARLVELTDAGEVDVIVTTGGTGVAARDVTPEATRDILEKEIPGMSELMRTEGLKATPLAVLSRGVCGTRGRTLMINVPGSPKGALESLNAIAHLVPHVVDLLRGKTEHAADSTKRGACR
ncbi:MAG: MogA/MoaB family molybdenum cofactor biosynthesis protein [Candidatus Solibacter usitatus]|nr:MogA/MoaB family molybdenum cofactor biosynthesis protein [Candidatus Solibacter usitatus]